MADSNETGADMPSEAVAAAVPQDLPVPAKPRRGRKPRIDAAVEPLIEVADPAPAADAVEEIAEVAVAEVPADLVAAEAVVPEAPVEESPSGAVMAEAALPEAALPEAALPEAVAAEVPEPVVEEAVAEAQPEMAPSDEVAVEVQPAAKAPKAFKTKPRPVAPRLPKPAVKRVAAAPVAPEPAPAETPVVPKPKAAAKTATPKTPAFFPTSPFFQIKDKTMDFTTTYADGFKDVIAEAQTKAKEAFEKSSAIFTDYNEFAKGNVEAVVESGKILAAGLQGMGSTIVSEGKSAFEAMTADAKELAAAKTPADFFKMQSDLFRKNFDTAVAYGSKNSEAMMKLANEIVAPISGRVSLAVEKIRQAA
jgi:phasin family protein